MLRYCPSNEETTPCPEIASPARCYRHLNHLTTDIGTQFTSDATTDVVTFLPGYVSGMGAAVTAAFVRLRFDTDYLDVDLSAFSVRVIPAIPLVQTKN